MAENGKEVEGEVVETIGTKGDDAKDAAARLTGQLMSDPNVLAAFEQKLGSMVGQKSGYIESLPKAVKRRLKALKKLQADHFTIESKFYDDVHELECKYESLYQALFNKRQEIVNAIHEPTDSECEWESDDEEEEEKKPECKIIEIEGGENKQDGESEAEKLDENTKGVPEFWLTIFKNVELLASMLQDHDEPILKSLLDIHVKYSPVENMGFTLEFLFAPNDFFNNTVLTKEYKMRSKPDPEQPLDYNGPEITKCIGCNIDWKKGKNVTVKNVKQKQKGRGGSKKIVTKTVKAESFFNFFSPPEVKEDEEPDEETESLLVADYETGQLIQSSIIPKAVLYFTGDALDDDCCADDFEDGEEGEDGEYDEDEDPDYKPAKGAAAPECKQQ